MKGAILKLRKNCWHKSLVLTVIISTVYVYGRKVALWSDHKPLETISKEPLATAPKHLHRLRPRLQQYDVEIGYKPGPEMYPADTLSLAYLLTTACSPAEEETEQIHAVDFFPVSETQLAVIQSETVADSVLQCLIQVILQSWPDQPAHTGAEGCL